MDASLPTRFLHWDWTDLPRRSGVRKGDRGKRARISCPAASIRVLSPPGQTQHLVFSVTLSYYLKFATVCVAVHVFLNITYFSYWKYFLNGAYFSLQASAHPFFSPGRFREPLGSGVAPWVSGPREACPAHARAPLQPHHGFRTGSQ